MVDVALPFKDIAAGGLSLQCVALRFLFVRFLAGLLGLDVDWDCDPWDLLHAVFYHGANLHGSAGGAIDARANARFVRLGDKWSRCAIRYSRVEDTSPLYGRKSR